MRIRSSLVFLVAAIALVVGLTWWHARNAAAPKVAAKYYQEDTTPLSIELTDPPPPEGYKIELTSK